MPHLPPKFIKVRKSNNINSEFFIQDIININWERFQLIPFVEDAWNFLYIELVEIVNKHAPWTTIKVKGRHLPWIKGDLIQLFKQRDKAWKRHRTTKAPVDWSTYKELRNKCKTYTRNAKANYFKDCLFTDFKNAKQFWKRINSITNKSSVNSTNRLSINDETVSEPSSIAEAFSQHFSTIGSSLSYSYSNCPTTPSRCGGSFSFRTITPTDVKQVIDNLNSGCSAGPDGLEIKFFKLASHVLSFPLSDLFNLSLTTCKVPSSWKCARVIPLHKGGDSSDINNYKPISIINTITKIFEKLIFNELSAYLNDHNLLSAYRSGLQQHFSGRFLLWAMWATAQGAIYFGAHKRPQKKKKKNR